MYAPREDWMACEAREMGLHGFYANPMELFQDNRNCGMLLHETR